METDIKQELTRTYLIAEDKTVKSVDFRFKMLLGNNIRGLLRCRENNIDDRIRIYYDITGMTSLKDSCESQALQTETVCRIITTLFMVEDECRDYMMNLNNISLNPEHIFIDDGRIQFCYLPWEERNVQESFHELIRELLDMGDSCDIRCMGLLYELHGMTRQRYNLEDVARIASREESRTDKSEHANCKHHDEQEMRDDGERGAGNANTENYHENAPFENAGMGNNDGSGCCENRGIGNQYDTELPVNRTGSNYEEKPFGNRRAGCREGKPIRNGTTDNYREEKLSVNRAGSNYEERPFGNRYAGCREGKPVGKKIIGSYHEAEPIGNGTADNYREEESIENRITGSYCEEESAECREYGYYDENDRGYPDNGNDAGYGNYGYDAEYRSSGNENNYSHMNAGEAMDRYDRKYYSRVEDYNEQEKSGHSGKRKHKRMSAEEKRMRKEEKREFREQMKLERQMERYGMLPDEDEYYWNTAKHTRINHISH